MISAVAVEAGGTAGEEEVSKEEAIPIDAGTGTPAAAGKAARGCGVSALAGWWVDRAAMGDAEGCGTAGRPVAEAPRPRVRSSAARVGGGGLERRATEASAMRRALASSS